ncbi:MAG: O-antigen ligase family protein [Xenococcaceae cyanobacterium MO_188.B32]|nr:O-antigen ligase family protein [Xenococcaceae cyanobacterium MO_188.B32]
MQQASDNSSKISEGRLLLLLTGFLYVFFTLFPDSHSITVSWSFVFLWQVGLLLPVFCLLWWLWQGRLSWLGNGLDWIVGLIVIGLFISTIFAQFPHQAFWYSWIAICFLAVLYVLNSWLNNPQKRYRILVGQGYLNIAFIVVSLFLWTGQTLLPELARIKKLQQLGVNLKFDFSVIELRNWAPIGHQNYVAGYLLLCLPLLMGLGILQKGWRRWLWFAGVGLGLVDLYTTNSRGGWLGLIALVSISLLFLLGYTRLPRLWLGLAGISALAAIVGVISRDDRFSNLITDILSGNTDGQLAYRLINVTTGWRMGMAHPFTGIGLGGVPLLYQAYRPSWAGRESELAYQLHTTPFQLWAEMGIWSIAFSIVAIALFAYLFYRWQQNNQAEYTDRVLIWCLGSSLLAYGVMSLTDYQLDNICISGTLVIFLACLSSTWRQQELYLKSPKSLSLAGLGLVTAVIIWLIPVHRAWQLSHYGFSALAQNKIDIFVQSLNKASQLAPWEPYYPYQLGWNLGNLALQTKDISQRKQLTTEAIAWLAKGVKASPYREFGHSNLGWLLLNSRQPGAIEHFVNSARLVPAKRGIFYSLGFGLLSRGKVDLAIEAFSLEGLHNPLEIVTSPIWRSPELSPLYPQILQRMETRYTQLLQQQDNTYWYRCRGSLYWWQGNLAAASRDWAVSGTSITKILLYLDSDPKIEQNPANLNNSAPSLVIEAWLNPAQRSLLLQQAWLKENKTNISPEILEKLLVGMNQANSFTQWLQKYTPAMQSRRQRLGFGVVSRHIDGAIPADFLIVVDNIAISTWFQELFPSYIYAPEIDRALQPWREELMTEIELISKNS